MSSDVGPDLPLSAQPSTPTIPTWFRVVVISIAALLILLSGIYFARYTYEPERFVAPSDLGLGFLILSGVALMLAVIAPWGTIGRIFSKLGPIEFARILETQTQEHAEAVSELRVRLDEVEEKARGITGLEPITEHLAAVALHPLLTKFLRQFAPTAFSPVRIQKWGSRQPGFEEFAKYTSSDIRIVLQKMVADGSVTTTISQLGNTLYRSAV
jgi:hypothetical protein